MEPSTAIDDDESDALDEDRIRQVKNLLYSIHRQTNVSGLKVADIEQTLRKLKAAASINTKESTHLTFFNALF